MNKDKLNDEDLIEDFLDGKLSQDEEASFHERRATDIEFAQLYNFRMKIAEDWRNATDYAQAKQQAKLLIESVRQKKNRDLKMYFALAASLIILIAIPGVILVNRPTNNFTALVEKGKPDTVRSYQPQLNLPEEKASIFYLDTVILISPIKGKEIRIKDSIFFSWMPPLDSAENLIIENRMNRKIIFNGKIEKGLETFALDGKFLSEGEYAWHIGGLSAKDSFKVVK